MSTKLFKLPSPSMLIAMVALFVALTSTAYAASLQKNSVTTKTIKNNAVTGAKVKSSTITGSDVKNNSLSGSDVNESTLGTVPSAASATSAASAAGVAANSIDGGNVKDRSLSPKDFTHLSGSVIDDIDSVPANSCIETLLNSGTSVDLRKDAVVVTVGDDWPSGLSLTTENSNSAGYVRLNICNVTNAAIDPDEMPFRYAAFTVE